jgi:hypothetical protein
VLGTQLAICQRANGQSLERPPARVRQTTAALDDVGPAKRHQAIDDLKTWLETQAVDDVGQAKGRHRHRRWLEIVGFLIVVLAGLFVITEVTGVTPVMASIAQVLGLRKPNGLIVVHLSNPDFHVLVNGNLRLTALDTYSIFTRPSGCVVDVFRGDVKTAHEFFMLKPGMMVELDVLKDGRLVYGYDGPIRSARRRSDQAENPGLPKSLEDPKKHWLLVERIAQGIRSDAQAMSLLAQIKSTTEKLEHTKSVGRGEADPAEFALQERLWELQLKYVQQKYNEHVRTISETIPRRTQSESVPDQEKRHFFYYERFVSRERIIQEFRRDPEVVSLIDQIKSSKEELNRTKGIVRDRADPARVAVQRRLAKLTQVYNYLWKIKSEEIRQRLQSEQSLEDAVYYDLWKRKSGGISQRSLREQPPPEITP